MSPETLIGIVIIVLAVGTTVALTLWSRRIIERIHAQQPGSLREIQEDINDGGAAS